MFRKVFSLCLLLCLSAIASSVSITGNFAVDGWDFQGSSLEAGKWAKGATSGNYFSAYTTSFKLGENDLAHSSLVGNPTGLLTDGSLWMKGDIILGVGVMSNSSSLGFTSGVYYKLDLAGTGTWQAADSVGGSNGNSHSETGSVKGGIWGFQHPHTYYDAQAYRYTNANGDMFRWGHSQNMIDYHSAIKSFSMLGDPAGSGQAMNAVSSQFLFNYSLLQRLGVPVAGIGSSKIVIGGYGQGWGQDMVIGGSGGAFNSPVPEPGTIALTIAGAALALRRRKPRAKLSAQD